MNNHYLWRLLFGDLEGAGKILNEIVSRQTYTAIPHLPDRRWRWPPLRTFEQKALFTLATFYDLKHQQDRAVNEYRKLLRILEEENLLEFVAWQNNYYDLGHYLQDLIETPAEGLVLIESTFFDELCLVMIGFDRGQRADE